MEQALVYRNERILSGTNSNASTGTVKLSPVKLIWVGGMMTVSIVGAVFTISLEAILVFVVFTSISLCFGHSLGMHRRLIHKSFECPKWLEYFMVHLGVIVGLAGPFGMIKTHDIRDWAQRQNYCHDYFSHGQPMLTDAYWQLFCDFHQDNPPTIAIETDVFTDPIYHFMEKYWMLAQLPWAILFYAIGGWAWVIWGVCMRVTVSVIGHWLVGYFAHNQGQRHWHVEGAHVQGYNIPIAALLTMGESFHNNHHAFPQSAKMGLKKGEVDIGWYVLKLLEKIGLVKNLKLPQDLPKRKELQKL